MRPYRWFLGSLLTLLLHLELHGQTPPKPAALDSIGRLPGYSSRLDHDPNGLGKFYFGREIAQVMGHQAADWLERTEREEEERTDVLLEALAFKPGEVVADIGAGSGYFSWRIARKVGDRGKVY